MRNTIFFLILLCYFTKLSSQSEHYSFWQEYMELFAEQYEDESNIDEIVASLEPYLENPINLNDTTSSALFHLFFLNEFQITALRAYIQQNGQLLSLSELLLINGFNENIIQLIKPFVIVENIKKSEPFRFKDMFRYGKNTFTIGTKRVLEKQEGYMNNNYLGSPFRLYFRYIFKYRDNIFLSLSGEKDAGEEIFKGTQKQGFDYYGFSLLIKDFGRIQQLVIGKFHVQFGQGLTLWVGSKLNFATDASIKRQGLGLRQSSAFCESGYLQGIASKININNFFSITGFYSYTPRDGTGTVELEDETTQVQNFYTSGYHRTQDEYEKKGVFMETIWGGNIQYQNTNLAFGITGYKMLLSVPIMPEEKIYNYYYFSGNQNFNIGIDATYLIQRFLLFGEISMSSGNHFSGIGGLQFNANSNTFFTLSYRNYSKSYQNLYACAFGQNTRTQNEKGIYIGISTLLPFQISCIAFADIFQFPWLKYQVYSPSEGSAYSIRLSKEIAYRTHFSILYRYKNKLINTISKDNHTTYTEEGIRQYIQLHLNYKPTTKWNSNTKFIFSKFYSETQNTTYGFLIYQDFIFSSQEFPLIFVIRYALFDIDSYNARIYTYEHDFTYEYSIPSFLEKGSRFYILLHWKIIPNIKLGIRYAITLYSNKATIGSGNDLINGNHKQDIKLQLKWIF